MEKTNYETYEYLPANASENDQFFVVQDNGTFVISRQAVQYATQIQPSKEALETVQVYNVTPQQFLVDVDNSSELISVSDQFIIPDGENNLYANSYLLQPGTSTSSQPMDQDSSQDVAVEFKEADPDINMDIVPQNSKQASSLTEITLTDDQYQILEQRGWILLETSDKIYVLDTLGLHDITTNHKLIQKLKNDGYNSIKQELENSCKIEKTVSDNATKSLVLQDSDQCIDEKNIVLEHQGPVEINIKPEGSHVYNEVNLERANIISSSENKPDLENCVSQQEDNATKARVLVIENEDIRRVGNVLKVKTKLSLKDFPEKIVLGKMVNGKNLIAQVVKQVNGGENDLVINDQNNPDEDDQSPTDKPATHLNNGNILNESEFYLLIKHFLQNNLAKYTAEDVVTADSIISQLIQIPSFKSSVLDNNLVITKILQNEDSSGQIVNKGLSALVTGRVSLIADQWRFVHLPQMLQNMVNSTEEALSKYKKNETIKKEDLDIHVLHVQISEAKQAITDVVRVSVTLNKRNIPVHLISNKPKPQPSTMYACSYCAALFDTETELKDHQTDKCMKEEEMLISIDMDKLINPQDYCVINKNGRSKSYSCTQCNATFSRLTTCKNHLKTHYLPKDQDTKEKSNLQEKGGIYKCNMCSSAYFHPSTLTKHIMARHIKIKK